MNGAHLFRDDFHAVICEGILQGENSLLISGNNFGAKDNDIAFREFHAPMFTICNPRESRARLTLTARAEIKHMSSGHGLRFVLGQQRARFA